jgi:hypothetical protein
MIMQNLIAYSICGEYISSAIQAGGLPIVSANGKDLGPNLIRVGFVEVTGALQKGDVAIIQAIDSLHCKSPCTHLYPHKRLDVGGR